MIRLLPVFLGVGLCSALGFAFVQHQGTSRQLVSVESCAFTYPTSSVPSQADITAFATAHCTGQALPSGWAIAAFEGKVTATDTGLVMQPSGERAWNLNVVDDQADLDFAKLYVNSQLVFTATRASGSILDRNGMSIATLPALVPPAGQAWIGSIEWTSTSGVTRTWNTAQ